jgi:hypothetical protein
MLIKEMCFYLQLYGTFSKTFIKTTAFGGSLWLPPVCSVRPDVVDGTSHSLTQRAKNLEWLEIKTEIDQISYCTYSKNNDN